MRKWLEALVEEYIPAVEQLQNTPADRLRAEEWATWMRQKWAAYGMAALKQQRNLMTDVRRAIKERLGKEHVALEAMNFTMDEWIAINEPIDDQVARRNENVVLLDNPDAIVSQAVRLLESREWAEVAAGLVVVTGRRSTEILGTADFQPKSQWSVLFSGALKRRGETQLLSIEIPTLTTAERVITALAKLRRMCSTIGLTADQINQKYSQAVAAACDRHFSALVPNRDGRDNLFTHLFRSVYAAIATHWYAPPTVDANEYKAAIQGHYAILDTVDGARKRSLAAARHYNDYKIGDRLGNIDGRQGIKLGYGGVEVIETFQPRKPPVLIKDEKTTPSEDTAMTSVHRDDQHLFESISEALEALPVIARENQEIEPPTKRQMPRRMKSVSVDLDLLKAAAGRLGIEIRRGKGKGYDLALLELLEQVEQLSPQPILESVPESISQPISQTVADQAKTLAWLTGRVEALEADLAQAHQVQEQLRREAKMAKAATPGEIALAAGLQDEIDRLERENDRLSAELQQTQSRLEGIQQFLSGGAAKAPEVQALQPHPTPPASTPIEPPTGISQPSTPSVQADKSSGNLDEDALRALDAIFHYNDSVATSNQERWAISIPIMKDLLKQVGKATQPKIDAVLKAKSEAIATHHRLHGLGERHNRVHKGISISDFIRL